MATLKKWYHLPIGRQKGDPKDDWDVFPGTIFSLDYLYITVKFILVFLSQPKQPKNQSFVKLGSFLLNESISQLNGLNFVNQPMSDLNVAVIKSPGICQELPCNVHIMQVDSVRKIEPSHTVPAFRFFFLRSPIWIIHASHSNIPAA